MRREYPEELEAFYQDLALEMYLHRSGQKARLDLAPVYGRHSDLFRREEIDELRADAGEAFLERDRKAYRYMLAAAVEHHLESLASPLVEEIAAHDAAAVVSAGGREVPLRAVPVLVANEPRPEVRRDLEARAARALEETNDLRAERIETIHDAARALGAASLAELLSEARGVDYAAVASEAAGLMAATERPYADALEARVAAGAGVRLSAATAADASRAFRLAEYDRGFPPSRRLVVYHDTLAGLGVRAGRQANVTLDLAERPAKIASAFCAAIRVPERVVVVARPAGGYADYLGLFAAAGRAQHAAFTSPETRTAFRRAGDRAAARAFALLFRNLLLDPGWVAEFTGVGPARDYLAAAALHRCHDVRRDAALAVYEEEVHSGRRALADAPERYEELLGEATRVAAGRAAYLRDAGAFRGADALRAWALEAQLRERLKTRFGRRWWASRAAGELLKEVWATGSEYSAAELAAELELGALSLGPLEEELLEGVGR